MPRRILSCWIFLFKYSFCDRSLHVVLVQHRQFDSQLYDICNQLRNLIKIEGIRRHGKLCERSSAMECQWFYKRAFLEDGRAAVICKIFIGIAILPSRASWKATPASLSTLYYTYEHASGTGQLRAAAQAFKFTYFHLRVGRWR